MKPKLADGSRWQGSDTRYVEGANGTDSLIDDDGELLLAKRDGRWDNQNYIQPVDALAVIRAAGLDPVWDAAVRLREHWRLLGYVSVSNIACDNPQLTDLLNGICAAVASVSEKETGSESTEYAEEYTEGQREDADRELNGD